MSTYKDCLRAGSDQGETRDCVVITFAMAFQLPYSTAHAVCERFGRKHGGGMNIGIWRPMFEEFGKLTRSEYLESFPTAITLTRALKKKPKDHVYVVKFRTHVACWRDGQWQDWMTGRRRHHVWHVFRLET